MKVLLDFGFRIISVRSANAFGASSALLLALLCPFSGHAQLVQDGGMVTINGTPTNIVGNLVVGTNGFWTNGLYTTLMITNAGTVTNTGNGTIGLNASAAFNQVVLFGTNSIWSNGGNAYIGSSGPLNRLLILQGARTENDFGNIGLNAGSRDNSVLVSGAGSIWANNNIVNVGNLGASNQLIVSSGGKVTSSSGRVGSSSDASNNLAVVMDPNSVWINSADLTIGSDGSYNALVVTNGGKVSNTTGSIGLNANGDQNWAIVMGPNALWTNSTDLFVGKFGSYNDLLIGPGGVVANRKGTIGETNSGDNQVIVSGGLWTNSSSIIVGNLGLNNTLQVIGDGLAAAANLYVGHTPPSSNNYVTIGNRGPTVTFPIHGVWLPLGAGSLIVTNSTASSITDVRGGTVRLASGLIQTDFLSLTNGPLGRFLFDGGTLIARGGMISNTLPFSVGASSYADPPATLVIASNQPFVANDSFIVGSNVPNCQLFVTNGGTLKVLAVNSYVGYETASTNNLALIGNPNSVWTNASFLSVGYNGSFSQLVVSNRGRIADVSGTIGYNSVASNNLAIVTGTNSLWTNSGYIIVGNAGPSNRLQVTAGGVAADDYGAIGSTATSFGNTAIISGPGSLWTNRSDLYIGDRGSFNQLVITNGGKVTNLNAYISLTGGASNQVLVTGTNSLWGTASNLYVAYSGFGNQLMVSKGGVVRAGTTIVGYDINIGNDLALISDPGSQWISQGTLFVGDRGQFNTLVVTNGGALGDDNGVVGNGSAATGNKAIVTGGGSIWTNGSTLTLGGSGSANQLLVTNGGVVRANGGILGLNSGDNLALITGAGSLWTNRGELYVGDTGSFNQLLITDGATVAATNAHLGHGSGSSNNLVQVSGTNSLLSNISNLKVGSSGLVNALIVTNAGTVANATSSIGDAASSDRNSAIVTGPNSVWASSANLYVGNSGSLNQLVVSNGGLVTAGSSAIGQNAGSDDNLAIITGAGSKWTSSVTLNVGGAGSSNELDVDNNGTVSAPSFYLGFDASSTLNTATLAGGNLIVTNVSGTGITDVRRGTLAVNSGLLLTDNLWLTNGAQSVFTLINGTLQTRNTTCSNGALFAVGPPSGNSSSVFELLGNGTHNFANGLQVNRKSMLTGNGTINGNVTVMRGILSPGASVGRLIINGSLTIAGGGLSGNPTNIFELDKASGTNDNVVGLTSVSYLGVLLVTNLGGTLAAGDTFQLFSASNYSGAFTTLTLPALSPGLAWTNKLLVDGSIAVFAVPPADRFWTNALGGNYDSKVNWLDLLEPEPQDTANFTNNANYQVSWPADAIVANAVFNASSGTVTQAMGSASWTINTNYIVGRDAGSAPTVAQVSGALVVTNAAGTATLEARRGTLRLEGGSINADQLIATNSAGQIIFNGGTLITRGGTVSNTMPFTTGVGGNTPAVLDVRAGQPLAVFERFFLGSNAANNQLYITNGGALQTLSGLSSILGNNTAASNNVAVVSGSGSFWTNNAFLVVGASGSSNQLIVMNAGNVRSGGANIGSASTSRGNLTLVTGTNSLWRSSQNFTVGGSGSFNQLVVTNGGIIESLAGYIGNSASASNNAVLITGLGSVWANDADIFVGNDGSFNQLIISNGGCVVADDGYISANLTFTALGSNNAAIVAGAGSRWTNLFDLSVGDAGSFNSLIVSNGGAVISRNGGIHLGRSAPGGNDVILVTGSNSVVATTTSSAQVSIGERGSFNQLTVNSAATVVSANLYLGLEPSSSNNTATVNSGNVIITNTTGSGVADVRRGTLALNGGLLRTDHLLLTNGAQSVMDFNFGTLQTRNTTCSNGMLFAVGNGSSFFSSVFELVGNGTHRFANGLQLNLRATLKGNGTIIGDVTIFRGTLSPGASIGQIVINGNLTLQGVLTTNVFELDKTSGTNDSVVGISNLTYAGALVVSNLSGVLANGDAFKLFSAATYNGSFSSISPAAPGSGLRWVTNTLPVDGTLRVASVPTTPPVINGITVSNGTNIIISATGGVPFEPLYLLTATNVVLPMTNWAYLITNYFDVNGNASITNAIAPTESQRYFRMQVQ